MRYHNYILYMLRKEREMCKMTTCAQCKQSVLKDLAVVTVKHLAKGTLQEHFCSEHCANQWYLERLRKEGL